MNSKVNKKLRKNKRAISKSSKKRNLKMNKISRKKKLSGGDYRNTIGLFTFVPPNLSPRSPTTTSPKEPISWKNYHNKLRQNDPHLYKPRGADEGKRKGFSNPSLWRRARAFLKNPRNYLRTKNRARKLENERRFRPINDNELGIL